MWFKRIMILVLIVVGIITMLIPSTSGTEAYFAGEDFYIGSVEEVESGYVPYLKERIGQMRKETLGAHDKKILYAKVKPQIDVLDVAIIGLKKSGDTTALKEAQEKQKEVLGEYEMQQMEIDEKYAVENMDTFALKYALDSISKKIMLEDYIAVSATNIANPQKLKGYVEFKKAHINKKVISKQDNAPYLWGGILLVVVGLSILAFDKNIVQLHLPIVKWGIAVSFIAISLFVAMKISTSISNSIKFDEIFEQRTEAVKEHLGHVRTLQLTYYEEKGVYSNDWNKLIKFAKTDSAKFVKYLVNRDDTAAVNNALRNNLPLEDTVYVPVTEKCFKGLSLNLDSLAFVPFSTDSFAIDAEKTERNGRPLHLFEIKTPKYTYVKNLENNGLVPANFDKKRIIAIGSMEEPTTEGNW